MGALEKLKWQEFYNSPKWRRLREKTITILGISCMRCHKQNLTGKDLQVDHVIPRITNPKLSLDITNLQILCEDCNCNVKGITSIDYRSDLQRQALLEAKANLLTKEDLKKNFKTEKKKLRRLKNKTDFESHLQVRIPDNISSEQIRAKLFNAISQLRKSPKNIRLLVRIFNQIYGPDTVKFNLQNDDANE